MKKFLRTLCLLLPVCLSLSAYAQCTGGKTQAVLNWDNMDYYYNSGSNLAPYGKTGGNYVTNSMEQTQRFAMGPVDVTFAVSAAGVVKGENATHTGNLAGYAGEDAQFTPTATGQTITLTFSTEVENASFTLYDVDALASLAFSAKNAANVAQNISSTLQGGSTIAVVGNNTTALTATATATAQGNSSNAASITITVAGPVKSITISVTTLGTDPTFWMSDVMGCTALTFPTNYQQTGNNRPLTGPAGNQPDYFLVTPDNDSCYMVDPVTGKAWALFGDNEKQYLNSFAVDPYNHVLYYVAEVYPATSGNKKLKRYDFATGTISTVFTDISTALNLPTFDQSLEGAGCAFYNGSLYLGIEGGKFDNTTSRESMIFKVDFDASLNPIAATQAWATPCYSGTTFLMDWADFVIKNGTIYNYSSAKNGTSYAQSTYKHINMMDGTVVTYTNPGTTIFTGQSGMDWVGNLYTFFSNGIAVYNENGTNTATKAITNGKGGTWVGGNGDASENFRPMMDFGDAPASYDPVANSPAAHEVNSNLKLGGNIDLEWTTKGQTALANLDGFDDALPFISTYSPTAARYLIQATVLNNTGANATVGAWLDANGNGVFDASEGVTVSVPTNAAPQTVWLFWNYIPSTLPNGTNTYLRIRVTSAANGMTTANPTGWYNIGEVEDYRIPVGDFALAVVDFDLNAALTQAKTVKVDWTSADETNVASYVLEKSTNGTDWTFVSGVAAKNAATKSQYEALDNSPAAGMNYYRIRFMQKDGSIKLSNISKVDNKTDKFSITLAPNPARSKASVYINSNSISESTVEVINAQGVVVYQQQVKLVKGTNAVPLPVENKLPSGRYIVRVRTGSDTYSQSLIVNK